MTEDKPNVVSMFDRKPVDAGAPNDVVIAMLEQLLAEARQGEVAGVICAILRPNGTGGNAWAVPNDKLLHGVGAAALVARCFQDMVLMGGLR